MKTKFKIIRAKNPEDQIQQLEDAVNEFLKDPKIKVISHSYLYREFHERSVTIVYEEHP